MLDRPSQVFYENASTSLLARTPAIIPEKTWDENADWNDLRLYLEQVLLGLKNWRYSWWQHWGDIAANILPRRYLWLVTPNNFTRGLQINQDVVDSTPTQAVGVCAAGMMDGLSSPTKTWFKLQPAIKGFEPDTAGKRWLWSVQSNVYEVLAQSNYYESKYQMYEDEICFGQAPVLIYEHRDRIINCHNGVAGEYYLATGSDNEINVFDREFTQTVRQLMERFGPKALQGTPAGELWGQKGTGLDTEFVVGHSIEPNYSAAMPGQNRNLGVVPGGYAYREVYWLRGQNSPQPLSVRGFHEKPYICPRWNTKSFEAYGRSPGMDALPDVRQLHQMTRRLAEAVDKGLRPPQLADATLRNEPASIIPGRVTYVPNLATNGGMRPIYQVDARYVQFVEGIIEKLQQRVERWFFNDVFMMISQMEGIQPRNELELAERRGEKLLRLGPVIERNLREDAAGINRILSIMTRRGLVPPQPPSLHGVPIEIKFVSKLALIQEASVTGSMERTLTLAGRMEQAFPGTLDNINGNKFLRDYGDKIEFPPDNWATEDEMKAKAQQRAQAAQQAQAAQTATHVAPAMAGAAKDGASAAESLAGVPVGGGLSALQMLLGHVPSTGGPPAQ